MIFRTPVRSTCSLGRKIVRAPSRGLSTALPVEMKSNSSIHPHYTKSSCERVKENGTHMTLFRRKLIESYAMQAFTECTMARTEKTFFGESNRKIKEINWTSNLPAAASSAESPRSLPWAMVLGKKQAYSQNGRQRYQARLIALSTAIDWQ